MADVLVQTRVPERVAKWLARRAALEGDTIAGWTRRLFVREATMARIKAWVFPLTHCDPQVIQYQGDPAHFVLELIRELSPTASVFSVGWGEATDRPGTPIQQASHFVDLHWFRNVGNYRVVLGGSPHRWLIAKSMFNETARRLELTLDVDTGGQAAVASV